MEITKKQSFRNGKKKTARLASLVIPDWASKEVAPLVLAELALYSTVICPVREIVLHVSTRQ